MFKELAGLTKSTNLTITIAAHDEEMMRVVVIPTPAGKVNPALTTPMVLTATPEKLDEIFAEKLLSYSNERRSLEQTLEETCTYMQAAGKEAKEAASKAASSVRKPEKSSVAIDRAATGKPELAAADNTDDDSDLSLF